MTNRKSYMRFRLVPKSMTSDDLEGQIFVECCSSSHILEVTTAKRMKTDPYYQRQKCRPMSLVSGNIRRRLWGYSRGFPWVGASNDSGVVDDGNFWRFGWPHLWKRS